MFAPLAHEEDGAENFVADGDDGALVTTSNEQGLKLRFEHGSRPAGGMSELAEQAADNIERAATIYSLICSAKLNDIDP